MSSNLNQQLNQLAQMDQFKDMNQFMPNQSNLEDFVSYILNLIQNILYRIRT